MKAKRCPSWLRFAAGFAFAVAPLAALAEVYLRFFPPKDLHSYLGERSPLTDVYIPDDDFGVAFRSWDAFRTRNAARLHELLPFGSDPENRGMWAFFGNSFVQAPGMLADHARSAVPDRCVFNLGRNEHLFVRLAQIKVLLENGIRPERVFIVLLPVDLLGLGEQPLDTVQVTSQGAIAYRLRLPERDWVRWTVEHSRLATTAWLRTGQHRGNPHFRRETLYDGLDQPLLGDLTRLFAHLARLGRRYDVPVTIILPPAIHQVLNGASFGFQDTLGALFRGQGFDVLDPRDAFLKNADPSLFLPDKHFSPKGNQLLLAELLAHVRLGEALADSGQGSKKR